MLPPHHALMHGGFHRPEQKGFPQIPTEFQRLHAQRPDMPATPGELSIGNNVQQHSAMLGQCNEIYNVPASQRSTPMLHPSRGLSIRDQRETNVAEFAMEADNP